MKKILTLVCIIILALGITSCGDKSTPSSNSNAPQTTESSKKERYPEFAGDVLELFGLEYEEAFKKTGDGAITDSTQLIFNDDTGLYINLTNSVDDMETFRVGTVTIEKPGNLSFFGLKIGDSLKDANTALMNQGASYSGELNWKVEIDGKTFSINLGTSDDETISSISATDLNAAGNTEYELDPEMPDNPYAYTQDMHEFEPEYWQ